MNKIPLLVLLITISIYSQQLNKSEVFRVKQKGTIITGTCLLSTSYLIGASAGIFASIESNDSRGYALLIPIAGPFILWSTDGAPWDSPYVLVPIGLTAAQVIGTVMIIKGSVGKNMQVSAKAGMNYMKLCLDVNL